MAATAPVEFRLQHESLPAPAIDVNELGPVPLISSDSQSFVVIKSAADLDELSDDNEIADISMLQEHKQILQDELAQFEPYSTRPQPSLAKFGSQQENQTSTASQELIRNDVDLSFKSSVEEIPNGSDPPIELTIETNVNGPDLSTELSDSSNMSQSVLPAMPQPQICRRTYADDNDSRAISIVSFAPSDFGSEEIQAKVTQLIDENTHLKDTIIQNNMSMKAQYDRIVAWQKDVERVHEAHKEKFKEAKNCIETLKEENTCLKQEIDNLRYSLQLQRTEYDKTKQILTEASENNLKEFELDVAKSKIKELEKALQKLNVQDDEEHASETAKWKGMEDKLLRYEMELENAYKQINSDKGVSEQERSVLEKTKLIQEKLLISEMANERANREILSLRNQLARFLQTSDDTAKVQLARDQAVTERNKLFADLESRNATIMDAQIRCQKLEQDLHQVNDKVMQYEHATKGLKESEEEAKIEAWVTKQKLAEMEQKYQFLQKSHEALQQSKAQHVPEFSPGELAFIRQQLMQSQRALTESEQNRAVADAKVGTLKNEIVELERQLKAKENDGDDLFALRAQLDVYKADFEAERDAKEDVKRDKNKVAEDLQHLHRRNQQLQEEIELLREQLQQNGSIPRTHPEHSRNQAASERGDYIYKCPKCNFGFSTYNAVENHVVRCIELDDALP